MTFTPKTWLDNTVLTAAAMIDAETRLAAYTDTGDIISVQTLGADAATIDFPSIPAGFRTLYITGYGRFANAATTTNVGLRFNGDIGSNYSYETLSGAGAAASAGLQVPTTNGLCGCFPAASTAAARVGQFEICMVGYANSVSHKTWRATYLDGTQRMNHIGGWWQATAAITRITFMDLLVTSNFLAGTEVVLYGRT